MSWAVVGILLAVGIGGAGAQPRTPGRPRLAGGPGKGRTSGKRAGRIRILRRAPALEKRTYRVLPRKGYVFAASTSGLNVLKRSRGGDYERVGGALLPDSGVDLALRGKLLVIAQGTWGLAAFDVRRPERPEAAWRLALPGAATAVALGRKAAYVGLGTLGLGVVSLSRRGQPSLVRRVSLPEGCYVWDLALERRRLAVACGRAGVVLLDLRRPLEPKVLRTLSVGSGFGERARGLAWWRGKLLVAGGGAGLLLLDPEAGLGKQVVARSRVRDFARAVSVAGRLAAVAAGQGGVAVFRLEGRHGVRVVPVASVVPRRACNEARITGAGLVYVAHDSDGMLVYRLRGDRLLPVGRWPAPSKGGG